MELKKLKKIPSKNSYPEKFFDKYIFKFLKKEFEYKPKVGAVPKKEPGSFLPYSGNMSILSAKLN